MAIEPAKSEHTDVFKVGSRYTGEMNVSLFTVAKPVRYGFIYLPNSEVPGVGMGWDANTVVLPFPPESITTDEPAATNIVFTQGAGRYIEKRGQIAKTITISGTTGFNYDPKNSRIVRAFMTHGMILDSEGPDSGMGRFLQLRNVFRDYWAHSNDPENAETKDKSLFIWVNEKEDEAWAVEPLSFRLIRQSPREKFTYRYEIQLQTIALLDDISLPEWPTSLFGSILNAIKVFSQLVSYVTQLIDAVASLISYIADTVRAAVESLITLFANLMAACTNIVNAAKDAWQTMKALFPSVAPGPNPPTPTDMMNAYTAYLDAKAAVEAAGGTAIPPQADTDLLNIVSACVYALGAHPELAAQPFSQKWSDTIQKFSSFYGPLLVNEAMLASLNKDGVSETVILPNDTIAGIALRELGDSERFNDLIILNQLRPPYLSPSSKERRPGTLAPGDRMLIPKAGGGNKPQTPVNAGVQAPPTFYGDTTASMATTLTVYPPGGGFRINQWAGFTVSVETGTGAGQVRRIVSSTSNTITIDYPWDVFPVPGSVVRFYLHRIDAVQPRKSAAEQALGADLALSDSNDLRVSSSGSIQLVDATNNMKQAVNIKLSTRPGELPAHPSFGLSISPGTRATPEALLSYRVAVRRTLLSDARISAVRRAQVTEDGDKVRLTGYIELIGQPQPLALNATGGF